MFAIPPHHQLTNYEASITKNLSSSKAELELLDNKITFFTDGSDRNGIVRGAAIQQGRQELTVEKMSHKGNSNVLNRYVAELYGKHIALQIIC